MNNIRFPLILKSYNYLLKIRSDFSEKVDELQLLAKQVQWKINTNCSKLLKGFNKKESIKKTRELETLKLYL